MTRIKRFLFKTALLCGAVFFLGGAACSTVLSLPVHRLQTANDLLTDHPAYHADALQTPYFPLWTASPFAAGTPLPNPLTIVLEGDGYAWVDRATMSDDPTPRDPTGLRIALNLYPQSLYLARPCQYAPSPKCNYLYWTFERFSPEVLKTYHFILDHYKAQNPAQKFHLVGFSGGAYVALLLAATRQDIAGIDTFGGLLDANAWTALQDTTPLHLPPEAAGALDQTSAVPFIDYCGEDDSVIPCDFQARLIAGRPNHHLVRIPHANHPDLWRATIQKGSTP